ncbi:hypothetical protein AHF37_06291 [Paragonimus kellicotti]|nr:hypothetical protein AHF37_06291 [Paragonimus kellicotti]
MISWTQNIIPAQSVTLSPDSMSSHSTISGDSASGVSKSGGAQTVGLSARKGMRTGASGLFRLRKSQPFIPSSRSAMKNASQLQQPSVLTVSASTSDGDVTPGPDKSSEVEYSSDNEEQHPRSEVTTLSPWLLRLFESSVFTMDLALQYLFKSEESWVKFYLAKRLFAFPTSDVDFYLPQLVSLCQKSTEMAKHLCPYFIHRCTQSTDFAIHLVWHLDTFDPPQRDSHRSTGSLSRPSSVPTFSQSAAASSFAVLNQFANYGQARTISIDNYSQLSNHNHVNLTTLEESGAEKSATKSDNIDPQDDYSTQKLRDTLFPSQEYYLHFLRRVATNVPESASRKPNPNALVRRAASGTATELGLFGKSIDFHEPHLTGMPNSSPSLGHKRAVSDVTNLVTHQNPRISKCKPPNGSSAHIDTREIVAGRWSSTDSAVGLSGNIERSSENPLNHQTESTSGLGASIVANGLGGSPHVCYSTGLPRCGLNSGKVLGSTGSVNKVGYLVW